MKKYKITGIYESKIAIKMREKRHFNKAEKAILKYGDIEIELHHSFLSSLSTILKITDKNVMGKVSLDNINMFQRMIEYITKTMYFNEGMDKEHPKLDIDKNYKMYDHLGNEYSEIEAYVNEV